MPKLKVDKDELNIKALEDAEYSAGNFQSYDGEVPATGTMLRFRVVKMWWSYTSSDDPMLKVLCVAEDNPGELEEYDGLPAWENMALTAKAKFKWAPFLEHFGLTLKQIMDKTMVSDEDDDKGAPIEKIDRFVVGSDSAVFVGIVKKERRYDGKWQAHIGEWLDADTELEEEDEPEEKPKSRAKASSARKPASSRATSSGRRAKPEPEEDEPEDEEEEPEEEKPARSRATRSSTSRSKPSGRTGTRRRAADEDEDEPPF